MAAKTTGLVVKRHNIRIWCHECDLGRLARVVWTGQGGRLLSEVSSQPVVRKFLEAVPYIMNTIRDIHEAVIQNNLERVMKLSGDPVVPQILSSRDTHNMTVMHKAAGLGYNGILKYLIERFPEGINDVDDDGKTPLHYAATVRDDQHTYNTLVSAGADESIVDNKNKTPGYYVNRTTEVDKNIFKNLPEAPRTPSSAYPASWDWKILDVEYVPDLHATKKTNKKKNIKASNENISSKNNTTTTDNTESHVSGMKGSSTHEIISTLPDLDDNEKPNITNGNDKHEHENNQVANEDKNDQDQNNSDEIEENKDDAQSQKEHVPENKEENHADHTNNNESKVSPKEENSTQETTEEIAKEENNEIEPQADKVDESDELTKNETEDNDKIKASDIYGSDNVEIKNSVEESNEILSDHDHDHDHDKKTSHKNADKIIEKIENNKDVNEKQETEEENKESTLDNENNSSIINKGNARQHTKELRHSAKNRDDIARMNEVNQSKSQQNLSNDLISVEGEDKSNSPIDEGNQTSGRNNQENFIEGVISSEAEQETLDASISQKNESVKEEILIVDNEIDPEVTDLINTANMEMLATLVLNGEGARLMGRYSANQELQAFLENVPVYMKKINKVHIAAKDGNLKDLQAALDRRKFAIARDPISPNGATPLHVATVFGKTNIVKYLGGRFPETLSAVDFEGRTSLHYAAVLPDNGHYYNLLQQLGANSKDLDDMGRSAEDYYKNPTLLPINQLLSDFGVSEEIAKNIFSDKGISQTTNGLTATPIFHTDEGRYLAKSLGDPLIKGLTEVANIKPKDPVAFLASFLHNFPEHEKPRVGTQESNILVTKGGPEVENDHPPPIEDNMVEDLKQKQRNRTATIPNRPIDVIAVDPDVRKSPAAPEVALTSDNRDEHGQSMLHFAAARTHSNNALLQILQEADVSLGFRDELYRTARDISIQANVLDNTAQIDKYVLQLTARGNTDKIMELLLLGYDHILDVVDDEGVPIAEVIGQRGDSEMGNLLASIPTFEETRDAVHRAARSGNMSTLKNLVAGEGGRTLVRARNTFGRTVLHTAVLAQKEEIVAYLAEKYPELLTIGDNLERTPLHYAMGVDKMESLSHVLIKAGAKRVIKDLKGRQPSYYFMNKSDILRLKEEEEAY
ncbi:uncharacterized protein LOC121733281 [Aricia agestis]|uniref:uncharacterized protein LOC121733281 n=1 Tax=Aricia agestis TaxID=91739 RepID=UPI001C203F8D|nr:uncharacterized protein LOC121733281 [Aricia agestis]XP_041979430.1 uncharacterized protein LOC121733281 [Aricia agestis]